MSEARWCDRHGGSFSALDPDARRINIEEPEIVNGIRRGVISVQRDHCGKCMRESQAPAITVAEG